MMDNLGTLFERCKGLVLDTNILLVFIVGSADRLAVGKRKRTNQYKPEDFDLLLRLSHQFHDRILTTPNILTEVSNLLGEDATGQEKRLFDEFIHCIENIDEKYLPSRQICKLSSFPRLGLTDSGISEIKTMCKDQYLVITDDLKLYTHLTRLGIDVLNFTHLRESSLIE
jgi:hypothetical protein